MGKDTKRAGSRTPGEAADFIEAPLVEFRKGGDAVLKGATKGVTASMGVAMAGGKRVTSCCVDFKNFVTRGPVLDMAVGMTIALVFRAVVESLVNDVINPFIALTGRSNMENKFVILRYGTQANASMLLTIAQAANTGAITFNYGKFLETVFAFMITCCCLYFLVQLYMAVSANDDWPCPRCCEKVKEKATRCPHCQADPIAKPPPEASA